MRKLYIPSRQELEMHASDFPEINPSAVIAMLQVMQADENIRHNIFDILEQDYQLSEGKLRVMIILHQQREGMPPSVLAKRVGVTKATISLMLRRMQRDGIVRIAPSEEDKRTKIVSLTLQGNEFMQEVLPDHYRRISRLMGKLSPAEQNELIALLQKLSA